MYAARGRLINMPPKHRISISRKLAENPIIRNCKENLKKKKTSVRRIFLWQLSILVFWPISNRI